MLEETGASGQMRPVTLTQASLAPPCCVSAFLKALPFLSENFKPYDYEERIENWSREEFSKSAAPLRFSLDFLVTLFPVL